MRTVHVRYHACEWGRLADAGYVMMHVYLDPSDGATLAVMPPPVV
jgi:hypothetical protein